MSKGNTLFSYFSKTPKGKKPIEEETRSDILSQKKNGNSLSAPATGTAIKTPSKSCKLGKTPTKSTPKSTQKGLNKTTGSSSKDDKTLSDASSFEKGNVVWSKLEGYPWWPSLVCAHPKSGAHVKVDKTQHYVHVQFFDEPPSRGWVKQKYVKPFTGSEAREAQRGGQFYSPDPKCLRGALQADKAMEQDLKDRLDQVVAMESSSSSSEEEEDMDVEMAEENKVCDGELDSSKENKKEAPKKTPKRSSAKKVGGSSASPKPKRRRIVMESDSDDAATDEEFKPVQSESSNDSASSGVEESEPDSESEPETPVKSNKRKRETVPKTEKSPEMKSKGSFLSPASSGGSERKFTPSVSNRTISKLASFSAPESSPAAEAEEARTFPHLSLEFLQPSKLKDAQRRPRDHPEYDCKTVHLPDGFLNKQTPGMRQWWVMKATHFDTVLFFKMGKFYELFHMDAVIAVNEVGLIYMKGEHAHSGFPEIAYGRYADTLIQKGYKVARIEQTETPDVAAERCKSMGRSSTKFDKVVRREICSIQTKGTKRYSFIDGDASDSTNAYLLSLCEKEGCVVGEGSLYGVCFVDTSIGKFHLGQFEDDRHCSRLRTLISHHTPAQILLERGKLSEKSQGIFANNLPSVLKDMLKSSSEFWDAGKTLKWLSESDCFTRGDESGAGSRLPDTLQAMVSEGDSLGHTPADGCELALSALGAVVWYLKESLMDEELLSMKNFVRYTPLDCGTKDLAGSPQACVPAFVTGKQRMVLDGVTLANLDILLNSNTGTLEGTLLEQLDQCSTPFGKRLLKQWVCAPLCNPDAINDRLDAMEDLLGCPEVTAEVVDLLKKLPDLERLLNKIHTLGSSRRSAHHPDSRAIFFEDVTYSKRKIEDFLAALGGFKIATKIGKKFKGKAQEFKSKLLRQTVLPRGEDDDAGGRFPDLSEELGFFDNAFDHDKAKTAGVIKPTKGVDEDYDTACQDIQGSTKELDTYLDRQKQKLGCRNIVYWGTGKNRFQMEIPEAAAKKVPHEYELASSKKGHKRYRTAEIERLLAEMVDAEERRDVALRDIMRRIFYAFDKNYILWEAVVQCLSVLDVLLTLAQYSRCGDGVMCRPNFSLPSDKAQPYLEIREGRHPCISRTFSGGDFIPNDTVIGIQDENEMQEDGQQDNSAVVLVTGPNMGGKSTLMRQVGVITILAHLGCYVPAETCNMTPVDRVFTRLGASDRIMAGESTFFVELSETSSILQHATRHSLVLVDELGRGTATYDGTAIACAVVNELSQAVCCRTLFSTHYHSLVEEFSHDPNVRLGHMACMVENENEEDPSQETITFLYKFIKGACPKSYGFNAARLASIPDEVVSTAHKKARDFERVTLQLRQFRELCRLEQISLDKVKDKIRQAITVT